MKQYVCNRCGKVIELFGAECNGVNVVGRMWVYEQVGYKNVLDIDLCNECYMEILYPLQKSSK